MYFQTDNKDKNKCNRCGRCCTSSSPALLLEDLPLLAEGKIPWNALYTVREKEPVHSPFNDKTYFLENEIIKIIEVAGTKCCKFYDEDRAACTIFEFRPAQCRAQECWNPKRAMELEKTPHLKRADIFADVLPLLKIIKEHGKLTSFEKMKELFEKYKEINENTNIAVKDNEKAASLVLDKIVELIAYEDNFREVVASKYNIPDDNLPLIFGRSLTSLVKIFGLKVDKNHVLTPL